MLCDGWCVLLSDCCALCVVDELVLDVRCLLCVGCCVLFGCLLFVGIKTVLAAYCVCCVPFANWCLLFVVCRLLSVAV